MIRKDLEVMLENNSRSLGSFSRSLIKERWYLDSGCSQHMTGNKSILTNLQVFNQDSVIFGDGAKGRIIATWFLIILGYLD